METLIVYCKVQVGNPPKKALKADDPAKESDEKEKDEDEVDEEINLADFSLDNLERELTGNKALIKATAGRDDGASSASDSEPSADNMEEEELAAVVPVKPKPKPPVDPKALKKAPTQKPANLITPADKNKRAALNSPEVKSRQKLADGMTPAQKNQLSGVKKPPPIVNVYDRRHRLKNKPEMRDAATQTTPGREEKRRQARREERARIRAERKERER